MTTITGVEADPSITHEGSPVQPVNFQPGSGVARRATGNTSCSNVKSIFAVAFGDALTSSTDTVPPVPAVAVSAHVLPDGMSSAGAPKNRIWSIIACRLISSCVSARLYRRIAWIV